MKELFLILTLCISCITTFCAMTGKLPTLEHFESRGQMKKNVNKIHKNASHLEHFDSYEEDFDNYESYEEEFENFTNQYRGRGMSNDKAKQAAFSKMSNKHGKKFTKAVSNLSNSTNQIKGNPHAQFSAMFDIIIRRESALVAGALPIPLFAALHYQALYKGLVNAYLPGGVTLSGSTVTLNGDVVFVFSDGVNNDAVRVSCVQTPYITFLESSKFNAMQISKFRYQLGDAADLEQFSQTFETVGKSLFGKAGQNQVSVGAQKSPLQYQSGIIDVDYKIDVNGNEGIIVGLIIGKDHTITLSCFVNKYQRTNIHA